MNDHADETSPAGPWAIAGRAAHVPTVTLDDGTGRLKGEGAAWLKALLAGALGVLKASGEVRVRVVDDLAMSAAHERYSGVAGTTDVLTFDLRDAAREALDVDILVCLDEAERQGAARGHSPQHELLLYALHGVLHCLGHDDHEPEAFARMHAAEDEVLKALGLGPVFAKPALGGAEAGPGVSG